MLFRSPLRIHAKSLSDALAPSKKISCGAGLRWLCEASAFIAGVLIVCKNFARKAAVVVWQTLSESEQEHWSKKMGKSKDWVV